MDTISFTLSPFIDILTLVLAGGQGERLYPLTKEKAKPGVYFAGVFRLIDFTLSNCVNSGIRKIYVLTQYMSTTLERHIREGWNIFCPELGEFIQTVPPQQRISNRWYQGTADAVFQNMHILQAETPQRLLILSGDHVYKMDYKEMLKFHFEKKAHLTAGSVEVDLSEATRFGVFEIDNEGRLISFQEKPANPKSLPFDDSKSLVSMGVYIFETEKLVKALMVDAKKNSTHDFGRDIIPQMLKNGDRIYCYDFREKNTQNIAYWRDIGTIDSYWEASMELLDVPPKFDLYDKNWLIRTYREQAPPAKIASSKNKVLVSDSLIAPGCIVDGARVEKSIISAQVRIDNASTISESVIMRSVSIGRGARIKRAIIDEGVIVPEGYEIGYNEQKDAAKFIISAGGIVVVPREMHLD